MTCKFVMNEETSEILHVHFVQLARRTLNVHSMYLCFHSLYAANTNGDSRNDTSVWISFEGTGNTENIHA